MIAANALSLIRMLLVMTLGVCSMLWVDYSSELSMYCGAAADCQIVRLSPFAYPLGVPLPAVALVGLLAILVLSFPKTTTFRAMFVIALALIGVGSLTLLALQAFVIKAFCPLCVTVDITLALTAVLGWRYRRKLKPPMVQNVGLDPARIGGHRSADLVEPHSATTTTAPRSCIPLR